MGIHYPLFTDKFLNIGESLDTGGATLYSAWNLEPHHVLSGGSLSGIRIWIESARLSPVFKQARKDGYILIAFECDGDLCLTASLIGESLYRWVHPAHLKTPARKSRLQAETRAIEDGMRSAKSYSQREVFLGVRDFRNPLPPPVGPFPTQIKERRELAWSECSNSAVGHLKRICEFYPDNFAVDDRQWLRVSIWESKPEFARSNGTPSDAILEAKVEKVITEDGGIPCFVVSGCTGEHEFIVVLRAGDHRFEKAYEERAKSGQCPLALDHANRGIVFDVVSITWPEDFVYEQPEVHFPENFLPAVPHIPLSRERWLLSDRKIREYAEKVSFSQSQYVSCVLTVAFDEEECAQNFW